MRALDEAVLLMLRTGPLPLAVYEDGEVPRDDEAKVVMVDLPYVAYTSSAPVDGATTYSGSTTNGEMTFDVMYVGADRNQAKSAGERAASRIRRLSPGPGFGIIRRVDSLRVRRDQTYTGPGSKPLIYGVDRYAVTATV